MPRLRRPPSGSAEGDEEAVAEGRGGAREARRERRAARAQREQEGEPEEVVTAWT